MRMWIWSPVLRRGTKCDGLGPPELHQAVISWEHPNYRMYSQHCQLHMWHFIVAAATAKGRKVEMLDQSNENRRIEKKGVDNVLGQHEQALEMWCKVSNMKDAKYRKAHIVWFNLHEISKLGKSTKAEGRLKDLWQVRWEVLFAGRRIFLRYGNVRKWM